MNRRTDERAEQRRREALLDDLRAVHRRERAPSSLRQELLERFAAPPPSESWFMRALARWLPERWLPEPSSSVPSCSEPSFLEPSFRQGWFRPRRFAASWGRALTVAPTMALTIARRGSLAAASLSLGSCVVLALVAVRLLSGESAPTALAEKDSVGMRSSPEVGPEPKGDVRSSRPALDDDASGDQNPHGPQRVAARSCPLFEVPSGAMIAAGKTDIGGLASGLALRTFSMETPSCGPLERRYIELVPAGVAPSSRAPVLLVLHDTGRSAELMRLDSRGHFDDLAKREGLILVYANAAPGPATVVERRNSGGWHTDEGTQREVDDEEYLERVLSDLVVRHVIDGNNDVYLVGYGGGAMLALHAAVRRPNAYAGVAAILPPKPEAIDLPTHDERTRLSRAFFMMDERSTLDVANQALIRRWGRAFGIARAMRQQHFQVGVRREARGATVEQLDVAQPASGSAAVRMLVVAGGIDPFPAGFAWHGRRASGAKPSGRQLDAAWDAWAFLSGADGIDAFEVEPVGPGLSRADGTSIRDVGFEDPEVVLDEEVVPMPPRPALDVPF
jgi:poly(3-hydroxybutyrate) depolymerase